MEGTIGNERNVIEIKHSRSSLQCQAPDVTSHSWDQN